MVTMLIGCLTAFGIYHHGGFNVGHVLSIITLALVLAGAFAGRDAWLGRAAAYVQTISFTTSFLLLMVFTTTETLTRLPPGHPVAASQDDPVLVPVLIGLLVTFLVGISYQVVKLRGASASELTRRIYAATPPPLGAAVNRFTAGAAGQAPDLAEEAVGPQHKADRRGRHDGPVFQARYVVVAEDVPHDQVGVHRGCDSAAVHLGKPSPAGMLVGIFAGRVALLRLRA